VFASNKIAVGDGLEHGCSQIYKQMMKSSGRASALRVIC
jgi:hypothetical protein